MGKKETKERNYLEIYVKSFLSLVSVVNSSSKGRDVMASIRLSSDIEVILCILRMCLKESLLISNFLQLEDYKR